ncbi:MAG: hypothetical protein ABS45_17000 [Comamonas sp. SCN 65-56]|uniref:hypothetical protein n=1 Tax=Comamonas sp. SCN 65-56 TaxID=1660095 RepID=UPI00086EB008|nr:hypothetical protein [Comamonas sp. SCN 65-56]ODS88732.1 MAG: hypothetical protein ABS45_17000 [Comamonas sp. SCN 65-56]
MLQGKLAQLEQHIQSGRSTSYEARLRDVLAETEPATAAARHAADAADSDRAARLTSLTAEVAGCRRDVAATQSAVANIIAQLDALRSDVSGARAFLLTELRGAGEDAARHNALLNERLETAEAALKREATAQSEAISHLTQVRIVLLHSHIAIYHLRLIIFTL